MTMNVFSSLARYADRQGENFLTEAFVYLLNLLVERDKTIGTGILKKLCGQKCDPWFLSAVTISITTQIAITTGRPDIVIAVDTSKVAFVEVKHDSPLGPTQLERYMDYLNVSNHTQKQLVLLTRSRHSIQETTLSREAFHHVCWYEISGWLSDAKITDLVAKHTVHQFLEFLREKEMTMEKVSWEYIEGVPAMIKLANMIYTAIAETFPQKKWKATAGLGWMGYYGGNNGDLFIGFRYNDPLSIRFENNRGYNPVTFTRELSLLNSHFFSLSADEQFECLIGFIQNTYKEYTKENLESAGFSSIDEDPILE